MLSIELDSESSVVAHWLSRLPYDSERACSWTNTRFLTKKDRHISDPLSRVGGLEAPMMSFSLIVEGTEFTMAGIGCRFAMRAPRPGRVALPPLLRLVMSDTTDAVV